MAFVAALPLLAQLALGTTVASGIAGTFGAIQQGQASAAAANYNAQLNTQNAAVAKENAAIAGQAGSQQAAMSSQKTRAALGSIKAGEAGSGIDVNSGSAVDVQASTRELGELDALTVRSNATKEAYGYQNQAENFEAQSNLDRYEAKNDAAAGWLNGATTLLGSAGNAATQWNSFKLSGAL